MDRNALKKTIIIWRDHPDIYAEYAFELGDYEKHRIELWSKQRELLQSLAKYDRITTRSGHKTGKSFSASIAAWWWFYTQKDAKVILLAPSFTQLNKILWTEIKNMGKYLRVQHGSRIYENVNAGIISPDNRAIFGFTANTKPEKVAGHSGRILYLVDEASGVPDEIHQVLGTVPNGKVFEISNPTKSFGAFYEHHQSTEWHKVHLSSIDAANENQWLGRRWKYENLANQNWVEARRREYHEGSYWFDVRVRGEFPAQSTDTVISNQSVMDAWSRQCEHSAGEDIHIGVDVARFGEDLSAIAVRIGFELLYIKTYEKEDTVQIADRVSKEIEKYILRYNNRRIHVKFDCSNGFGSGVFDIVKSRYSFKENVTMHEIYFGGAPTDSHYNNMRDQIWFEMSHWIDSATLPKDDDLRKELVSVKYAYDSKGKHKVESKPDLKKRIGRSPDRADALALACFGIDGGEVFCEQFDIGRSFAR